MKKILALVLSVVMLLTLIPTNLFGITAFAATKSGKCGDNVYWELKDGVMTISGKGPMWDFTPGSADFPDVPWKSLKSQIKKVVFKDGVTYVGRFAFSTCKKLEKVQFSDSINAIGNWTFNGCSNLQNPVFPKKLRSIGQEAFAYCDKITRVEIPDSVTGLLGGFESCKSLKYVYIGGDKNALSYTSVNTLFRWCPLLEKIEVSPDNIGLTAKDGVLYTKDMSVLIQYPGAKKDKKFTIPSSVVEIFQGAFDCNKYIESITIPVSVKKINDHVIGQCKSLKKIYYSGTQKQWEKIDVDKLAFTGDNEVIHFKGGCKHKYTNSCDINCDVCYAKRTIKHKYSSSCDATCNLCKVKRTVKHTYKNIVTKASLSKNGKISYKCSKCGYVSSSTKTIYKIKSIKLSTTSCVYNGKLKKPSVTVKDSAGKTLKKNTDYTVSYSGNCKNVGKYKVTVKFKGKYSGTKTLYFTINPPKTSVSKLTARKKSLTVKVTKKTAQVSGYQIQYSKTKNFESYKTATLTSNKKTSTTIKKLTAKKTYFVRVRTYKTVSGKKYYSAWSTIKYKKTK